MHKEDENARFEHVAQSRTEGKAEAEQKTGEREDDRVHVRTHQQQNHHHHDGPEEYTHQAAENGGHVVAILQTVGQTLALVVDVEHHGLDHTGGDQTVRGLAGKHIVGLLAVVAARVDHHKVAGPQVGLLGDGLHARRTLVMQEGEDGLRELPGAGLSLSLGERLLGVEFGCVGGRELGQRLEHGRVHLEVMPFPLLVRRVQARSTRPFASHRLQLRGRGDARSRLHHGHAGGAARGDERAGAARARGTSHAAVVLLFGAQDSLDHLLAVECVPNLDKVLLVGDTSQNGLFADHAEHVAESHHQQANEELLHVPHESVLVSPRLQNNVAYDEHEESPDRDHSGRL
mmetsp:Transcript_13240/g.33782  ORF Transcript_13240/g.33782 Transcript_13240/m.33782 type:complete len:345 (-) Transcript_13240:1001-2035(-)